MLTAAPRAADGTSWYPCLPVLLASAALRSDAGQVFQMVRGSASEAEILWLNCVLERPQG